jgi:hypothetical protein
MWSAAWTVSLRHETDFYLFVKIAKLRSKQQDFTLLCCRHLNFNPFFNFVSNLPVSDYTTTFVFPQPNHVFLANNDIRWTIQHSTPNSGQITQVENVVEFCWSRQHLDLKYLSTPLLGGFLSSKDF